MPLAAHPRGAASPCSPGALSSSSPCSPPPNCTLPQGHGFGEFFPGVGAPCDPRKPLICPSICLSWCHAGLSQEPRNPSGTSFLRPGASLRVGTSLSDRDEPPALSSHDADPPPAAAARPPATPHLQPGEHGAPEIEPGGAAWAGGAPAGHLQRDQTAQGDTNQRPQRPPPREAQGWWRRRFGADPAQGGAVPGRRPQTATRGGQGHLRWGPHSVNFSPPPSWEAPWAAGGVWDLSACARPEDLGILAPSVVPKSPPCPPPASRGGGPYSSSASPNPSLFFFYPPLTESSTKQTLQVPGSRVAAPRPPVPSTPTPPSSSRPPPQDDADGSRGSPPELPRTQRPSLPDLSRPNAASTPSGGMKHSSSAPPPAPPRPPQRPHPQNFFLQPRKTLTPHPGSTPPPPATTTTTTRDGPPPAPPPAKPPPSPVNLRTGAPGGQTLAAAPPPPPPPPYRQPPGVPNGPPSPVAEAAPELPQRHNSLHRKPPGPLRGLAPPPPNSAASPALQSSRPPPPARDPPSRGAAPPPPPPLLRNGGRDAPPPPPPPYRVHGPADPPGRGKPPPPPTRTPAGPPPPPPPLRNGHRDSIRAFLDDFESKYSFHPVEDFPAPEEYKFFQRIYPSKTNRATRGAPPLPPIPR
uniref:WAS/WASL-interacting protein family member 2 n=1 Tax=Anas platyrhynchos TaxID=8839 RepID=A0A8B9TWT6_ANAPL